MKTILLLITNFSLLLFPVRQPAASPIRQPLGTIGQSAQSLQYIVDQQGIVYDQASISALPLLIASQAPHNLAGDELTSLKTLNRLSSLVSSRVVGQIQNGVLTAQTSTTEFLFNPASNSEP